MKDNKELYWLNRKIVHPSHADELENASALNEFEHGLPRDQAEGKAYDEYRKAHHRTAASHHLRGMKAAQASGDMEEARKHGIAFAMHMDGLGHDPMDEVPEEIRKLSDGDDKDRFSKFKAHKADTFFLDKEPKGTTSWN